jgi:hypothetical protein
MLKASARVCRRRLSRIPTCWLRSQAARLQCPCRVRRRRCRTGCGGCSRGGLSDAHRLQARRLDRPRRRRHHHRRQRQSGVDALLSRRGMPERHGPGGEWRWRRRLPSAKQLSGRSGICRVHPVQASQGMASSRQLSGDISGAGAVLCISRHQERLARHLWHEEHNPIFSRGYGLWPNRMSLPL